jgi:hypothetical protein
MPHNFQEHPNPPPPALELPAGGIIPSAENLAPPSSPQAERRTLLDWWAVRKGLNLTQAGWLLFLISGVVWVATADIMRPGETLRHFSVTLATMVLQIAPVVALIGICLSLKAPEGSRARGYALGVVLVLGIEMLLVVAYLVAEAENNLRRPAFNAPPPPWSEAAIRGLQYSLSAGGVLCQIAYLLFLASVARQFGKHSLARAVNLHLLVFAVIASSAICRAVLVLELKIPGPDGSPPSNLLGGGLVFLAPFALGLLFWFSILMDRVRSAITESTLKHL